MSPSPDINLAARRLVELESIRSKLFDSRRDSTHELERCISNFQQPSWGRRELRTDLSECEWSVYQYSGLLHMLGEVFDRTINEFDVALRNYSQIRYEVPKLIGIRNAIHHNGLIGLNIAKVPTLADPVVVMPVQSIREHGSWGNGNPKFETFFHGVTGDVLVLESIIENSESTYEGMIDQLIFELKQEFEEDNLVRKASSIEIYS